VGTGGQSTQDKLLDAATRAFAEQGIENASLAEIVRAAGQRNASALHYHFGNRDEVLRAILERHIPALRARRLELLEHARARPADDIRSVAEAMVRPVMELARRGWRERAYLQIGAELIGTMDRATPEVKRLLRQTAGGETLILLAERCPPMPADVYNERAQILTAFLGRAAADRARMLDRRSRGGLVLDDDQYVDNLVDMFLGALTAPVTAAVGTR
jgi:AcrR family transcriptional regulator